MVVLVKPGGWRGCFHVYRIRGGMSKQGVQTSEKTVL